MTHNSVIMLKINELYTLNKNTLWYVKNNYLQVMLYRTNTLDSVVIIIVKTKYFLIILNKDNFLNLHY